MQAPAGTGSREPPAGEFLELIMTDFEPFWWCDRCFAEKSPRQVTYLENCTLCGCPVDWIETKEDAEEHGIEIE